MYYYDPDTDAYYYVDSVLADDGSDGVVDSGYGSQESDVGYDLWGNVEAAFGEAFMGEQGIVPFFQSALPYVSTFASFL